MLKSIGRMCLAWLMLFATFHVNAETGTVKSLENAEETSADMITLPSSDTGFLYFKNCPNCNQKPLQLTATSQFVIGDRQVTFIAFKKALSTNGEHFLTVFYPPTTRLVTRIVMMAPSR